MVESPTPIGKGMSLLEKIVKLCTGDYTRLEVWSDDDLQAKALKPFIQEIKRRLQEYHPDLDVLRTYRTDVLNNFDHPFLMGLYHGYVIKVSSNVDPFALKRTCMMLERDGEGNRIADIDVYSRKNIEASPRFGKVSRKQLNPEEAGIAVPESYVSLSSRRK